MPSILGPSVLHVTVLQESTIVLSTTDLDGDTVQVTPNFVLPAGADFIDNADGTYNFTWTPQNMDNVTLE